MGRDIAVLAARRIMEILGVDAATIERFTDSGEVCMSIEGAPPVKLGERELQYVRETEERRNVLVYHVVAGDLDWVGDCVNLLCIPTAHLSDLSFCEGYARLGQAYASVINKTYGMESEIGFITLEKRQGLRRTY